MKDKMMRDMAMLLATYLEEYDGTEGFGPDMPVRHIIEDALESTEPGVFSADDLTRLRALSF